MIPLFQEPGQQPPQPAIKPIVIEPTPATGDVLTGRFNLHDTDFTVETDPRYALTDSADRLRIPHFTPALFSWLILGKPKHWMDQRLKDKPRIPPLQIEGKPLKIRTLASGRGNSRNFGERRLTLADSERLAWALYLRGDIDGLTLRNANDILVGMARQHGWKGTVQ